MKHLKTYEDININKPQVGDYVIIDYYYETMNINLKKFVNSSIGKIISERIYVEPITQKIQKGELYEIRFWNIPPRLKMYFENKTRIIATDAIIHWSKNKKELEAILQAKNYNL